MKKLSLIWVLALMLCLAACAGQTDLPGSTTPEVNAPDAPSANSALPGLGSAAAARRLHMLASYWGFVLMSTHLGLHWGMVTAPLRRRLGGRAGGLPWCVGAAAGLYGAYAAWTHQIWQYLTLRSEFIQFDFDRPEALYFWDYVCMMVLFALLAYTAVTLARKHRKGAGEP